MRAAFDITGVETRARELHYAACGELLGGRETAVKIIEDLNDTSIGYVTIMALFDAYLDGQ